MNHHHLKDIIYLTLLRQNLDGSVFDADFCCQTKTTTNSHNHEIESQDKQQAKEEEEESRNNQMPINKTRSSSFSNNSNSIDHVVLRANNNNVPYEVIVPATATTLYDKLESTNDRHHQASASQQHQLHELRAEVSIKSSGK